ncbi:MAG: hypothetical protein Q4C70_05220, partial [Planctomycetia bacterium]|nr:hypothetical protein [Planctomycetia bacterium]
RNYIHRERNYVEYDVFSVNRAENRLLKSTIEFLFQKSRSSRNRNDLKRLRNSFGEVPTSENYGNDFEKCVPERKNKDYQQALAWCRVFLQGNSFSVFSGNDGAFALLFPMETLFESYVAVLLKRRLDGEIYEVSVQDRAHRLFDFPAGFPLRPDIVVRRKTDCSTFVFDTKWKILDTCRQDHGITQADMYQMYAYHKKYNAQCAGLIYPAVNAESCELVTYMAESSVKVPVLFWDLYATEESLAEIGRFIERRVSAEAN